MLKSPPTIETFIFSLKRTILGKAFRFHSGQENFLNFPVFRLTKVKQFVKIVVSLRQGKLTRANTWVRPYRSSRSSGKVAAQVRARHFGQ
jgi:hypothetical protein